MQIIPLTKERYQEWDDFCIQSDDAHFVHTAKWLEYVLNYKPELQTISKSFMVTHGSEIIAVCPLAIEKKSFNGNEIKEFTFGDYYTPFPAFKNNLKEKHRKKIEKNIFQHIDRLAGENCVSRSLFGFSPLSPSFFHSKLPPHNALTEYGYQDLSLNTSIIDLTNGLDIIKESLRRNHQRIIARLSHLKLKVYDQNNITKEIFKQYQEMHHRDAGRITRPQITFDMMRQWIQEGMAVLFELSDSAPLGYFYVETYKTGAVSSSCCNEVGSDELLGIQHLLNWHAIQWLIEKKFRYFELGPQKYGCTYWDSPSEKEISISLFKKGFGPETVPFFIGEKFYSKEYYLEMNKERTRHFLETFQKAGETR